VIVLSRLGSPAMEVR